MVMLITGWVKPKTIKLVFAASALNTQPLCITRIFHYIPALAAVASAVKIKQ
jgi:hypothetical protein